MQSAESLCFPSQPWLPCNAFFHNRGWARLPMGYVDDLSLRTMSGSVDCVPDVEFSVSTFTFMHCNLRNGWVVIWTHHSFPRTSAHHNFHAVLAPSHQCQCHPYKRCRQPSLDAGNSLPMVSQWIGHCSTAMTFGLERGGIHGVLGLDILSSRRH